MDYTMLSFMVMLFYLCWLRQLWALFHGSKSPHPPHLWTVAGASESLRVSACVQPWALAKLHNGQPMLPVSCGCCLHQSVQPLGTAVPGLLCHQCDPEEKTKFKHLQFTVVFKYHHEIIRLKTGKSLGSDGFTRVVQALETASGPTIP